jgi:cell fate regulator YaaT (PSP1 superfamily)
MIKVAGIRFKEVGKIYYFDPGEFEIEQGQSVVVETVRGIEYGNVAIGSRFVPQKEVYQPLKKILRIATEEDDKKNVENKKQEKEAFALCQGKIEKHKLEMKLIDVEFTFDNNKIIFYFTADGRVDFRELVKDLASVFRTRIELRQIGVRDEAKMIGGLGPCGRKLCCSSWLGDFDPVSIRMAKDQNLSLNPAKISGICGRLMCCLKYEHETYQYLEKQLPKTGKKIETLKGPGIVISKNLMTQSVKVLVEGKHERDREIIIMKVDEIEDPRGEFPRQIENPSEIQDMEPVFFASVNNIREKAESIKTSVQKPSSVEASRNAPVEEEKSKNDETKQKSNYKKRRRKKKNPDRKNEPKLGVQSQNDENKNARKDWNKRKPKG